MNILSKIQFNPDYIVDGSIIIAIIILLYILFSTIKNDRSRKIQKIERVISLEQLSDLWMKKNSNAIEIPLEVLTPIWREVEEEGGEEADIVLRHDRARKFWSRISKHFTRFPIHKQVCAHLMTILDKDGDCPSVVNKKSFVNDIESSWDSNSYSMLGMTKLIDHSINVAEHVIDLLTDIEAQHVIPDGIVAALAHDIGKIPSLQAHLYASGDHPIVAGSILTTLTGFKDLPEHDRTVIAQAVKHHHVGCEGLLPQNVRRADQLARQDEMDWAASELSSSQEELTQSIPQPVTAPPSSNQVAAAPHAQASGQPVLAANAPGPVAGSAPTPTVAAQVPDHPAQAAPEPFAQQEQQEQNLVTPAEAVATGATMRDFLTGGHDPMDNLDEEDEYEDATDTTPDETEDDESATYPSAEMMFGGVPAQETEQTEQEVVEGNESSGESDRGIERTPEQTEPTSAVEQQQEPFGNASTSHLPRLAPDPYPNQSGAPAGMENVRPGDPTRAYAADNAIFGNGQSGGTQQQNQASAKKDAPQEVPLGDWFSEQELIDQLKPHINKTIGKTFKAFSMPNGIVYFQTGLIESIVKSMASSNNIADIPTLVSGCKEMKSIILSVVNRLKDRNFIETSLVQKGYYGGHFLIQKRSGTTKKGYFTPFRAETFGMPSDLEALKDIYNSRHVLDFINVVPFTGQDE